MLNEDLQALRDYVMADTGAQNQAESTVRLLVTHSNLQASFMEIRLDKHVCCIHVYPDDGNLGRSAPMILFQ